MEQHRRLGRRHFNLPKLFPGEIIAEHFDRCVAFWEIDLRKILYVITDNGSNMVKAVCLLQSSHEEGVNDPDDRARSSDIDADDKDSDSDIEGEMELAPNFIFKRLSCLAHTLRLVIKVLDKTSFANGAVR